MSNRFICLCLLIIDGRGDKFIPCKHQRVYFRVGDPQPHSPQFKKLAVSVVGPPERADRTTERRLPEVILERFIKILTIHIWKREESNRQSQMSFNSFLRIDNFMHGVGYRHSCQDRVSYCMGTKRY